jgi:hypothetical protein
MKRARVKSPPHVHQTVTVIASVCRSLVARVLVATMAVSLLIGATVTPSGADAASGAQLSATPTTGLSDGQPIRVAGTGFAPNTRLHFYECRASEGCASLDASNVTDASGRLGTVVHVRRGLDDHGTPVDCTVTQCLLTVSSSTADASANWADMTQLATSPPRPAAIGLAFTPRAAMVVVPNRRLVNGQAITVDGWGLVPGQTVSLLECTGSPCTYALPGSAVVDRDGRVSIPTTVRRWIYDWAASARDLPYDCSTYTTPACSVALALRGNYEDGYDLVTGAKLNFAPTPVIFTTGSTQTWEGDTGTHPVEVRFGVAPLSHRPQVVRFRTYPWTASAADFVPIEGTATLPPGATEGSVTVYVRGDTRVEQDEAFVVEFRGTRRLTNTTGTAVVVITDDDG